MEGLSCAEMDKMSWLPFFGECVCRRYQIALQSSPPRPLCHGFALSVYQNSSFGGVWIVVLSLHCEMTDLGGCETVRIRVRIGLADCTQSDQKVGWTSAGIGRSQPRNQRHGCSRHGFDTGSGASNRSMTQSRPNHGPSGPAASVSLAILGGCRTMPICAGKGAMDRLRQTRGC